MVKAQMQKVLELLTTDVASIRTGRASTGLVDSLIMSVYGGQQRLQIREVASVTIADPGLLIISPWDKSIIGDIRKGILEANVGLNPSIDGEVIRIAIPPMTTEDREKYVKLLSTKLENAKIQIRQIRGDVMHDIKRGFEAKEITEDEKFGQEKKLQGIVDEFTTKIEEIGEKKKQELLQI